MHALKLSGKTFILGIGAQKTGTSWFYKYLQGIEDVTLSPIKELHFFDSWYRKDLCHGFNKKILNKLKDSLKQISKDTDLSQNLKVQALIDRVKMIYHEDAYLEHFSRIVPAQKKYFCEITPSYSLLRKDGFKKIKYMMKSNGINIKVFMFLRDPVDRHWSQICFDARRGLNINPVRDFKATLDNKGYFERTRYDLTIQHFLEVFDRSDIIFEFYEKLFQEDSIKKIMNFLTLKYTKPNFNKKINASPHTSTLSDEDIKLAVKKYLPVYSFCNDFFNADIPHKWRTRMDIS